MEHHCFCIFCHRKTWLFPIPIQKNHPYHRPIVPILANWPTFSLSHYINFIIYFTFFLFSLPHSFNIASVDKLVQNTPNPSGSPFPFSIVQHMDQQIQQAVDIALSGTADPNLKNQAFQFINQVKSSHEGYQTCCDLLFNDPVKGIALNEGLKFFAYQVIDENAEVLGEDHLYALNGNLFKFLNTMISENHHDQAYLKNKLSDVFARVFCLVYPNINTDFLRTLLLLTNSSNLVSIDYYLRILISVHYNIGDKLIARSKDATDRATVLKDLIRERDMPQLVESWKNILVTLKEPTVLDNALKVVGAYVDWMDIGIFIQNGFIPVIYGFLNLVELRTHACLALMEIISKKMKPANKLELIDLLDFAAIFESAPATADEDVDYFENLAKLANQIGVELAIVLENNADLVNIINAYFIKLWPMILQFLSHDYDDVSQQVFPFIQAYLLLAKRLPLLNSVDLLSTLLNKVVMKMKYDADSDGFDDDDDQFVDVRQKLKTFQDTLAILCPQMYLEAMPVVIELAIFGASADDWPSIELGLYELSNFGDSLKNNLVNFPKNEILTSKPYQAVQDFLVKVINNFSVITHPKNQLAFFELIIRHFSTKNFNNTTASSMDELVVKILGTFSEAGLFNPVESVRLRVWYLFFRFVNATKPKLGEFFLEELLMKFLPLLAVKAELPSRDEDDDVVENGNFSSQLYLFEALGILVGMAQSPETMAKCVDVVFAPLFSNLEECISREDRDVNPLISLQANHLLLAMASVIKGLDVQAPGKSTSAKDDPVVVGKVGNAAQVVLITLESFNKFEAVRDASRFAFARMIPILDMQGSGQLSKLVSVILAAPKLKMSELGDFVGFVGQLVHQFRNNDNMFQLLNDVVTPMVKKVFEVLGEEGDNGGNDDDPHVEREKYQLKRALLNFVSIVVLNNQFSLLLTESNKAVFPQVMAGIIRYASDLKDTTTAKTAMVQFGNVVTMLGCNGGKLNDSSDKFASTVAPVEGIDDFLMENTVKLCFEMPFQHQGFDLKDAQYRNLAQELSQLLKTYQGCLKQQEFVGFLVGYLVKMGLPQDMAQDFGQKLVEADVKTFRKYYVTFLSELK